MIAESEPELRKCIPASVLRNRQFRHDAFPLGILERALNNRAYFEKALSRTQDQLLDGMDRLPRHSFGAVPDPVGVDEKTVVKICTDQVSCLDESDGSCVLKAVSTNVRFPLDMRELAIFIFDMREFSAEQMPARFPLQERLKIVRRLFESGFLVK